MWNVQDFSQWNAQSNPLEQIYYHSKLKSPSGAECSSGNKWVIVQNNFLHSFDAMWPMMFPVNFSIFLKSGITSVLYWTHCNSKTISPNIPLENIAKSTVNWENSTLTSSVNFSSNCPLWWMYFIENRLRRGFLMYIFSAAISKSSQFFT